MRLQEKELSQLIGHKTKLNRSARRKEEGGVEWALNPLARDGQMGAMRMKRNKNRLRREVEKRYVVPKPETETKTKMHSVCVET